MLYSESKNRSALMKMEFEKKNAVAKFALCNLNTLSTLSCRVDTQIKTIGI